MYIAEREQSVGMNGIHNVPDKLNNKLLSLSLFPTHKNPRKEK